MSDQFSSHFGTHLIFFVQKLENKFLTNFFVISVNSEQLLSIFFWPQSGGGKKIRKLFPTNFLASQPIWDNFFSLFILTIFFGGWWVKKSGNYFRTIFSPFQPIWGIFVIFHVDQINIFFLGGGFKKSGNYFAISGNFDRL